MADKKPSKSTVIKPTNPRQPRTVTFTIPQVPRPKRPSDSALTRVRPWVLVVGFILTAVIAGYGGAALQNGSSNSGLFSSVGNQKKIVTQQSQLISQIAKNVGPSVVSVNVTVTAQNSGTSSLFSQLYGGGDTGSQSEAAAGTGIIISDSGYIVTNRHVVPSGTTSVSVTLADGTELKNVKVVGRTSDNDSLDIAFLKINDAQGHKLTPAVIGDSSKVQVGDDAVAIGNALGQFQNTVTSGIISGYGRTVQAGDSSGQSSATENLDNLFQTDAAINEGNSGGPLVNLNGQVIGINTAIAGDAQNVGFSIPINDVRGLIEQVLKTGKFERPYLGVRYVALTADIADQYSLKVTTGAYVLPSTDASSPSIVAGGPAEQAGIKEGDIILQVDGQDINQTHSLTSLLSQHQPGDKISLKIQRGDDQQNLDVTLGTLPDTSTQTQQSNQ